jgi:hypothetical protein
MKMARLSPEEESLLRFGVSQALETSDGVHKTEFDKKRRGESASILARLKEERLLRSAGTGAFFPTIRALVARPDIFQRCGRVLGSSDQKHDGRPGSPDRPSLLVDPTGIEPVTS